jgi:hypothetical protein
MLGVTGGCIAGAVLVGWSAAGVVAAGAVITCEGAVGSVPAGAMMALRELAGAGVNSTSGGGISDPAQPIIAVRANIRRAASLRAALPSFPNAVIEGLLIHHRASSSAAGAHPHTRRPGGIHNLSPYMADRRVIHDPPCALFARILACDYCHVRAELRSARRVSRRRC